MDKILFGDNQFFGVNHMSEEKARQQLMKFKDSSAIMRVLDNSYDLGINTFMCTTHDKIVNICDVVRASPEKYGKFKFYPCMPYAHKYNDMVARLGMLGALQSIFQGGAFSAVLRGGFAAASMDVVGMMKLLIDAEMKMFAGLKIEVVFLQNVLVDFLIGLGFHDIFRHYAEYVKHKYHAEPGFITMNLPRLLEILEEQGVENPIICSSINKIGFRMCGGVEKYEEVIRKKKFRCIAMSVFASGAIPPKEAIDYVCGLEGVQSILFGASSKHNIQATKELIEKHWGAVNI